MAKCGICGKKLGMLVRAKASDGDICPVCASICSSYATLSIATIQGFWETNKKRLSVFAPTQFLKSLASETISIDDKHRYFVFGDMKKLKEAPVVFSFDEIDSYEIETVGGKTVTKKKGGITRAIVGGAVAGPVGALVGSGTAKVETKHVGGTELTKVYFTTYAGKTQRMSSSYPFGFTDFLDRCMASKTAEGAETATTSVADEILKYKELLDQGVITNEEFSLKKLQLLGI